MSINPRPIHEVRLGVIKAAIWENKNDTGIWYNVTVGRRYKDTSTPDGSWKTTESFGRDDLLLLAKVVNDAHTWIFEQQNLQKVSRN